MYKVPYVVRGHLPVTHSCSRDETDEGSYYVVMGPWGPDMFLTEIRVYQAGATAGSCSFSFSASGSPDASEGNFQAGHMLIETDAQRVADRPAVFCRPSSNFNMYMACGFWFREAANYVVCRFYMPATAYRFWHFWGLAVPVVTVETIAPRRITVDGPVRTIPGT
jgi:hypothetical protein